MVPDQTRHPLSSRPVMLTSDISQKRNDLLDDAILYDTLFFLSFVKNTYIPKIYILCVFPTTSPPILSLSLKKKKNPRISPYFSPPSHPYEYYVFANCSFICTQAKRRKRSLFFFLLFFKVCPLFLLLAAAASSFGWLEKERERGEQKQALKKKICDCFITNLSLCFAIKLG